MPPPRLIRPLRPWHPPRTSAHARWASNGLRDKKAGAPGGGDPAQPAAEVNARVNKESEPSNSTTATGWWGRISALWTKPSHVSPEDQSSSHSHEPQPQPRDLPKEPTCRVCKKTFPTLASLHRHVLRKADLSCWPALFSSREEAAQAWEERQQHSFKHRVGGRRKWQTPDDFMENQRRVCKTCQAKLPTYESRLQHALSNEACWEDEGGKFSFFACFKCRKTFSTTTQARQHVLASPGCFMTLGMQHDKPSPAHVAPILNAHAGRKHQEVITFLADTFVELRTFSTPLVSPLADRMLEHLHHLYLLPGTSHALAKDRRDASEIHQALAKNPEVYQIIRQLHEKAERQSKRAAQDKRRSEKNARAPASASTKTAPAVSNLKEARKKPAPSEGGSQKTSKVVMKKHLTGPDPIMRKHHSDKWTLAEVTRTSSSKLATSSTLQEEGLNSAQARATLTVKGSVSKQQKPTVSSADPDVNQDLELQLQELANQFKLMQEKFTSLSALVINASQTTTSNAAQAIEPGTMQITDTSTVQAPETLTTETAKLPEPLPTISVQRPKDASASGGSKSERKPSQSHAETDSLSGTPIEPLASTEKAPSIPAPNPTPTRRYGSNNQAKLQRERIKAVENERAVEEIPAMQSAPRDALSHLDKAAETNADRKRLHRQMHTQARLMKSSDHSDVGNGSRNPPIRSSEAQVAPPTADPLKSSEVSNQSLLDELFPEASNYIQPHYTKRNPPPKLDPPSSTPLIRTLGVSKKITARDKYIQAFKNSMEKMAALQLVHCSTELTEADFRRLVPQGQHIEGWARDFYKIIPGRDPLSLERLPFYYLLFRNFEAALRYQNNAARLHKLSKLHGPTSATSALPPPPGLLENGEDLNAALSSYTLTPTTQDLQLHMVMQPYNPALRRLIEEGGYKPIVPSKTSTGKQIHKVLFHIEGYEPTPYDIYQIFMQDASRRGLAWPFLHEHQSIHRLRDIADLKTKFRSVSTMNPRSASKSRELRSHDPYAELLGTDGDEIGQNPTALNQIVMNQLYNRWIVEFSDEEGARRFARLWHRKALPMQHSVKHRTWRDLEEVRMCNAEYLW